MSKPASKPRIPIDRADSPAPMSPPARPKSRVTSSAGKTVQPKPPSPPVANATPRKPKPVPPPAPEPVILPPAPPSIWRQIGQNPAQLGQFLPTWSDEVGAVILIFMGGVTFASLLNTGGEGQLSGQVALTLKQGFGTGAYLLALGILGAGFALFLNRLGQAWRLTWSNFLALQIALFSLFALLHLAERDPEGRALARAGEGGGYVGWAVSQILHSVVGNWDSFIFGFALFASGHWLVGLRRRHYRAALGQISLAIQNVAERLNPPAPPPKPVIPVAPSVVAASPIPLEDMLAAEPVRVNSAPVPANSAEALADMLPLAPAPLPEVAPVFAANYAEPEPAPISLTPSAPIPSPIASPLTPPQRRPMPTPPASASAPLRREAPNRPAVAAQIPSAQEILKPVEASPLPPPILASDADDEFDNGDELPLERPPLVVNGQVVDARQIGRERPSIVPRDAAQSYAKPTMQAPQRQKKKFAGGRDGDPDKRQFKIEDFVEKTRLVKRDEALPPYDLLGAYGTVKPSEQEINRNASIIENTLLEFDIDADVIDVKVGPVVTQYAVSPIKEIPNPETGEIEIKRVRVDKIVSLQGDLALALSARTLRIEAPVPGHSYVGIEVPNRQATVVGLRPILETEAFFKARKNPLCVPLGRDVSGEPVIIDLATMPHTLIAGTTGSGKSVCLTSIVTSLIICNTPSEVRLIMLDPKRVELTRFNGLPHLVGPVETESERIIGVLRWATREMDRRYKLLELENARNIDAYNSILGRRRKDEHLPYLMLIFDEIGDLMMTHPDETEQTITRLAQKARAAGIHLIIATQRPSVDVLTGLIKANFPGRLSFAVASGTDSRVILDHSGAETLLGRGDMLFLAPDAAGPRRVQGCYISDDELEATVQHWRTWYQTRIAEGSMEAPRVAPWERGITRLEVLNDQDPLLEEAIELVCLAKEASTSMIQRRLGIGYPRAARLMDSLYELGIIGAPKAGGRPREVVIKHPKEALKHLQRNR